MNCLTSNSRRLAQTLVGAASLVFAVISLPANAQAPPPFGASRPDGAAVAPQTQAEYERATMVAFHAGDHVRLKSLADEGLVRHPRSAALWGYLAGYYTLITTEAPADVPQTRKDAALDAARRALELDPSPVREQNLAWVYQRVLGDCSSAVRHYSRAPPESPSLAFRAAECHEEVGDAAKARLLYEQVLSRAPQGEHADEARTRLAALPPPASPSTPAPTPRFREARVVHTFSGLGARIKALAFSPDGRTLAGVLGSPGGLHRWDVFSGRKLESLSPCDPATAVAFRFDGTALACARGGPGSDGGTIVVLGVGSSQPVRQLTGHEGFVEALAFTPDGARLASGSTDVRIWDVGTGRTLHKFKGAPGQVVTVAVSPDGKRYAHASGGIWDRQATTIQLRDLASGEVRHTLKGHRARVVGLAFSPDSRALASASWDGTVGLWDTSTGAHLRWLETGASSANAVTFAPSGSLLASGNDNATVRMWSTQDWSATANLTGLGEATTAVAFGPDGRHMATGSIGGTIMIWELVP